MYISELTIENFRSFKEKTTIHFHEGTNVIIGENNAGKTTIIKALQLLFDYKSSNKLTIDDFNRRISITNLKENPPKIIISVTLTESKNEEQYSDELVTVSTWLTRIQEPYEAKITFEFFLPERDLDDYKNYMNKLEVEEDNDYWKAIEHVFLKKYTSKIFVGNPDFQNVVQYDDIKRFDFQFLSAIRDVERDLYKGNNSLLKEIIDFFMDYDIKNDNEIKKVDKQEKILERKRRFSSEAKTLINSLQCRMKEGEKQILKYVDSTGAGIDSSKPSFDGSILDAELYSALRLIVETETGIKLPAINNGLGYNNLIYISLLLAKMQKDSSGEYLGSNAKVFSILAIEEPEAHLHPSMQYKFLKFLNENRQKEVNQIFVTTHSPNITAAVELDDLIVVQKINHKIRVAYPGRVFNSSDNEDLKSKNYVKRFIDVTKADIFFAKNIILVEGLTEQLLVPKFAEKLNCSLPDSHTTVINIGGRYFNHFLKLFDTKRSDYAIKKKVACITDLDPVRKEKKAEKSDKKSWKACFPILLDREINKYQYKPYSNTLIDSKQNYDENYIRIFHQKVGKSSTFEYDLLLTNPVSKSLITDSVSNKDEIKDLMDYYNAGESLKKFVERLGTNEYSKEIKKVYSVGELPDNLETKRNIIAGRYLTSIDKGEVAQELAHVIYSESIKVPSYIEGAIKWICQKELS